MDEFISLIVLRKRTSLKRGTPGYDSMIGVIAQSTKSISPLRLCDGWMVVFLLEDTTVYAESGVLPSRLIWDETETATREFGIPNLLISLADRGKLQVLNQIQLKVDSMITWKRPLTSRDLD
jgi:hypothetical protein